MAWQLFDSSIWGLFLLMQIKRSNRENLCRFILHLSFYHIFDWHKYKMWTFHGNEI